VTISSQHHLNLLRGTLVYGNTPTINNVLK